MDVEDLKKELESLLGEASKTMEDARVQLSNSMQDAREQLSNSVQDAREHLTNSMEDGWMVVEQKKEEMQQIILEKGEEMQLLILEKKEEMHQIILEKREEMQNLILEGQQQIQEKIEALEKMAYDIDWFVAVPLIISFAAIWSIFMFRTRNTDQNIASSLHAVVVVILAFGNMFWGLDEKFMFIVMTGYFISDLYHYCLLPEYFIYIFHHILTVFAIHYMVTSGHYAQHLMASKAVMVEISTPFLNAYRTTNKVIHGILFGISFLAVRVVWLAHITAQGYGVSKYPIEIIVMILFAGLNFYWFAEIAKQAYNLLASKPSAKEEDHVTPIKELVEEQRVSSITVESHDTSITATE